MVQKLFDVYTQVKQYIDLNQNCNTCKKARVSSFWEDIVKNRPNYPSINEIQAFRRHNFVYGIGGQLDTTLDEDNDRFNRFIDLVRDVPKEFISSLKEPLFGAPYIFEHDGIKASSAFVVYAGITWRCKVLADKYLSRKNSLNICDIGSGWGGVAFQLHSALSVNSCTIIDVPENLFLSSIYLQMALPAKTAYLVQGLNMDSSIKNPASNSLYFTLPQYLHLIDIKYDLIINSYSMQEMDKDTVAEYMDWVRGHLSDGGIFISINSHNKAGIKRASEYGFQQLFDMRSLRPFQKRPAEYLNTIPYEIVLSKKTKEMEYLPVYLDALCELMQLGLDGDISGLCNEYTQGIFGEESKKFLEQAVKYFYSRDIETKFEAIEYMKRYVRYKSITYYLEGNLLFALAEYRKASEALSHACEEGLQDFAEVKAMTMICSIMDTTGTKDKKRYSGYLSAINSQSPGLLKEITAIMENIDTNRYMVRERIFLLFSKRRKFLNACRDKLRKIMGYSHRKARSA